MVGKKAPIKYKRLESKCSSSNKKKKSSFIIKDMQDIQFLGNIMISINELTAFQMCAKFREDNQIC